MSRLWPALGLVSMVSCLPYQPNGIYACEPVTGRDCADGGNALEDGGPSDLPDAGRDAGVVDAGPLDAGPVDAGRLDYVGNWELPDGGPWNLIEYNRPAQLQWSTTTVREGQYAGRFEVTPTDNYLATGSQRCLVGWRESRETEGEQRYYALSMQFSGGNWNTAPNVTLLQWMRNQFDEAPSVALLAHEGQLIFRFYAGTLSGGNASSTGDVVLRNGFPTDVWLDLLLDVHWSRTDSGHLKAWIKTRPESFSQMPQVNQQRPTLQLKGTQVQISSFSLGIRRPPATDTVLLFQDGFRRGDSLSSVAAGFGP